MIRSTTAACALGVVATLATTSACSLTQSNATTEAGSGAIEVTSSATGCTLTSRTAPSGNLVFKVTNTGTQVTEFYLYGADGLRVVGEIENIGPGLTRDLVVAAPPGTYVTACKPGMKGEGIRSGFAVSDSGKDTSITGVDQAAIKAATTQYAAYVKDQSDQLLDATTRFVAAYERGDAARARALYPLARGHYERIEPVAESFGDLDPELDLREADLEQGQRWTGWHRVEKDLWPPASGYAAATPDERRVLGANLLASTRLLDTRVRTTTYTVDQIGNGSKSLLDEVAATKVTGEEEAWSRTDLYDFWANVEGARVAFEGLRPILVAKNPQLATQIAAAFGSLQSKLERYRAGRHGFVSYDTVSQAQRRELSDAVNALAAPLSQMTGAITL